MTPSATPPAKESPMIEQARQKAAAAYPEHITDTHGRVHQNIPRRAILSGAWDNGDIVKRYLNPA